MTPARLWLLIICALVLQQLLPALGATGGDVATTSAAWQASALGAPHGTGLSSR
jgi:hypothetical protein